jgi:ankyrin repeat protein
MKRPFPGYYNEEPKFTEKEIELISSVKERDIEAISLLIKDGVNINIIVDGNNLLYKLIHDGFMEKVKPILENGIYFGTDQYAYASPCKTIDGNHLQIIKLLVENGIDINGSNIGDYTPLYAVANFGHFEITKLLVDNGADVNKSNGYGQSPLYIATRNGHLEIVKLLVEKGVNINKQDYYGQTALYLAAYNGYSEIIKLLINNGADVNISDKNERSPLYAAIDKEQFEIAKFLIDKGADIHKKEIGGYTILQSTINRGCLELVKLLIEKGVDINEGSNECTPLSTAIVYEQFEILKLLISKGANINKPDKDGRTPLYLAALRDGINILQSTLDLMATDNKANRKADVNSFPFLVLPDFGNWPKTKLLIRYGAIIDEKTIAHLNRSDDGRVMVSLLEKPWTIEKHNIFQISRTELITLFKLSLKDCQIRRLPKELLLIICSFIAFIDIE